MRTALGRVLGLGSARSGTDDFVKDRIRAVMLLVLTPYVIGTGILLFGRPFDEVSAALRSPLTGLPIGVFIVFSILHMRLGMQTIIEDYIHHAGMKLALTMLNIVFCLTAGVACTFALARILL